MNSTIHGATARILIIEDEPQCLRELQRAFEQNEKGLNFSVSIAASASEAEPYIRADQIDIYIVDLELPEFEEAPNEKVGELLIKKIVQHTNGGSIIHSSKLRKDREDFLIGGVDDYIMKGEPTSFVMTKTFSLWRRLQETKFSGALPRKRKRQFRLGKWKFEAGNRTVTGDEGESIRLSPTELAFVQYLCTVDAELDRREFNVAVLGRPVYEEDMRIDNLVYRLREKLGDSFQIVSRHNGGTYKLLNFEEMSR